VTDNPLGLRTAPEQDRSRRRVATILDAAQDLVAGSGIDAVTMTQVAARARMSLPALYRYFPDRSALVRALVLRMFEQDRATVRIETDVAGGASVTDTARHLVHAVRRREREQPHRAALRAAVAADPELARLDVADSRANADALLAAVTRLTGRRGTTDLRRRLLLAVHLAGAAVELAGLLDDPVEGDQLLDDFADVVTALVDPAGGADG
jgi:AcrR family transcriptional regulator